jgi:hypothetical protein
MAIPPEPLSQVLPHATWVVDAEVEAILTEGEPPPQLTAPKPSAPNLLRSQRVRLKVKRVLRGAEVTELEVDKPEAHYLLRPGNQGPFLIEGGERPRILGRYGPDSYRLTTLEAALSGH